MLYMRGYKEQDILFVYNSASLAWIISVNKFRFFNNVSEPVSSTYLYYKSLEKFFNSASADVCCIEIYAVFCSISFFLLIKINNIMLFNIIFFICDRFFSVYLFCEVFLLYFHVFVYRIHNQFRGLWRLLDIRSSFPMSMVLNEDF